MQSREQLTAACSDRRGRRKILINDCCYVKKKCLPTKNMSFECVVGRNSACYAQFATIFYEMVKDKHFLIYKPYQFIFSIITEVTGSQCCKLICDHFTFTEVTRFTSPNSFCKFVIPIRCVTRVPALFHSEICQNILSAFWVVFDQCADVEQTLQDTASI